MATATAVNASEEVVIGFDDGAGLEAPLELDCPYYSKEAEEILWGRTCSFDIPRHDLPFNVKETM